MRLDPRPVRLSGSRLARWLLGVAGWKLVHDGLPARQGVIIVYPHTSNWDFPLGLLAKWGLGLPAAFWIKDSVIRLPLVGRWVRGIGGRPIDRSAPRGIVGQMADELKAARAGDRFLWLAIAPEGTRSYRDAWRSGFYHVAVAAQVPLGIAAFDYGRREVRFDTFLQLSGEAERDMAEVREVLHGVQGKRPAQAGPIRLNP